jgi:hypothetical protein
MLVSDSTLLVTFLRSAQTFYKAPPSDCYYEMLLLYLSQYSRYNIADYMVGSTLAMRRRKGRGHILFLTNL